MGMKILRHRTVREEKTYTLTYQWKDDPGAGFGFPCDDMGSILTDQMSPAAMENYEKCEFGEYKTLVKFVGISTYSNRWTEPAVGECTCGGEVILASMTNECPKCRALYNGYGQQLSDPSTWGEETGEHSADVRRWLS